MIRHRADQAPTHSLGRDAAVHANGLRRGARNLRWLCHMSTSAPVLYAACAVH